MPPPGVPGPFALQDAPELALLLAGAGLADVTVTEVEAPMRAGSFDEWWTRTSALAGPLAKVLESLPEPRCSSSAGASRRRSRRTGRRPVSRSRASLWWRRDGTRPGRRDVAGYAPRRPRRRELCRRLPGRRRRSRRSLRAWRSPSPRPTAAAPARRWSACTASPTRGARGSSCCRRSSATTTCSRRRWPGTRAARRSPARSTDAALADAVERAMDEAGFETAHIVGNSLGGYVALQLAARGRARDGRRARAGRRLGGGRRVVPRDARLLRDDAGAAVGRRAARRRDRLDARGPASRDRHHDAASSTSRPSCSRTRCAARPPARAPRR